MAIGVSLHIGLNAVGAKHYSGCMDNSLRASSTQMTWKR